MNTLRFITLIYLYDYISFIITKPNEPNIDSTWNGLYFRIVGGKPTRIEDFPFVVSIQRRYQRHLCGGTYILPKFILSAAHCMVLRSKDKKLRTINPQVFVAVAGSTGVKSLYGNKMQIKLISKVLPHPLYDPKNMKHDIGLYQVGYGNILRQVKVPLLNMEKCRYQVHPNVNENSQLCAGVDEGGVDSCQGDSGGPMLCEDIQVGIVSWGIGCGNKKSPGIYSRVDYYLNWINETVLKNHSPCDYKKNFIIYYFILIFREYIL